jgi:hypothetical protein
VSRDHRVSCPGTTGADLTCCANGKEDATSLTENDGPVEARVEVG